MPKRIWRRRGRGGFGERSDICGETALHPFQYNRPFAFSRMELRAIDGPLLPRDHASGGSTVEFS